jgi:hypothetical protein
VLSTMPSDHVLQLCSFDETVVSELALNPDHEVVKVVKKLKQSWSKSDKSDNRSHDDDDLDRAAKCGKFPYRPSDLFLKVCIIDLQLPEVFIDCYADLQRCSQYSGT